MLPIHRLNPECRKFVLDHLFCNKAQLKEEELQGQQHMTDYYNECLRSFFTDELSDQFPPVRTVCPMLSVDVLRDMWTEVGLRGRLCCVLGFPGTRTLSTEMLLDKAKEIYPTLSGEEVYQRHSLPVSLAPPLKLVECPDFVRREEQRLTKECADFVTSLGTVDNVNRSDMRTIYEGCIIGVCIEDVKKMRFATATFSVSARTNVVAEALAWREEQANRAAVVKIANNLSPELKDKFHLTWDAAYLSIGVPEKITYGMIEQAIPTLTVIPELKMRSHFVAVKKETTSFPKFEEWVQGLDKEEIELTLSTGIEPQPSAIALIRGASPCKFDRWVQGLDKRKIEEMIDEGRTLEIKAIRDGYGVVIL
jgi:hypothetical protein